MRENFKTNWISSNNILCIRASIVVNSNNHVCPNYQLWLWLVSRNICGVLLLLFLFSVIIILVVYIFNDLFYFSGLQYDYIMSSFSSLLSLNTPINSTACFASNSCIFLNKCCCMHTCIKTLFYVAKNWILFTDFWISFYYGPRIIWSLIF